MKLYLTNILALFFTVSIIFGQTINVDSLEKTLQSTLVKKEQIAILGKLVETLATSDPQRAAQFGETCLSLEVQQLDCLLGLANANFHLAKPYLSEKFALQVVEIAEKQDKPDVLISAYLILQESRRVQEKKEAAWTILQKALVVAENNDFPVLRARVYEAIGFFTIYYLKADRERGIEYYKKAVEILEKEEERAFLADVYERLGSISRDSTEVFSYLYKALSIYQKIDNKVQLGWMYFVLGSSWEEHGEFEKALRNYQKGLQIHRQMDVKGGVADHLLNIGRLYNRLGQWERAIPHLEESLVLAKAIPLLTNIRDTYAALATSYAAKKDFQNAHKFLLQSNIYKDSLTLERMTQQVAEFNAKFETEQKELELTQKELEISTQKNLRNRILIGGLVLLMLLSVLFQWRIYQQRQRKKEAELALQLEQKEGERLRELDRLKTNFFTNISHELRTPLTLISAPLQEALTESSQTSIRKKLEMASKNTQNLLGLVNEMLDLSKLEAGKIKTTTTEFLLLPFLRRLFYSFEPIAQLRGLQLAFNTNISPDLTISLDEEKLEKILNNLFSNAIKFTDKGGKITFNAYGKENQLELAIIDTGKGIKEADLPKIFDRYYQTYSEESTLQSGTGIGLSLAKELTHLVKGELTVESKIGEGSQFILKIPMFIRDKEEHSSEVIPKEKLEKTVNSILCNGHKPQLLIVEDNPEMSDYLAQSLSKDYQCTQVYDGLQALAILQKQSFDLITCDVMMPNLDGFSFREKLMEKNAWRQIPFVMLTARAMEEDKLRGLRLGIDDYLTKPFNIQELKARVHNLLTNKRARDQYAKEVGNANEESLTFEEALLEKAKKYVQKRLDDPQLRVDDLAKALNISSRHFARMLNKIIGVSPVNFILEIRLQRALQLLESQQFSTVSEVRYQIGIESASYFTKKFTERFGKNPKNYLVR